MGEMIAFPKAPKSVAGKGYTHIRGIHGTPAVRLGEGRPRSISPDKQWIAIEPQGLILLPTWRAKTISVHQGHCHFSRVFGGRQAYSLRSPGGRLPSLVLDGA
jgi:hypothetical protein